MSRLLIGYGLLLIVHSSCCQRTQDVRYFPDGFQFGASTSAYQVEGGWNEDGKGLSIWDIASHSIPSPIKDGSTGDIAADSYHLYRRDVEIMQELGLDYYRFSVSWTRILPNGFSNKINEMGVDYYNNLINEMLRYNITPFVTMYHWDLPHDLQKLGGWANPLVVDWFVDYAKVLFDRFGDRVKYWMTINEAKQICHEGYGRGRLAPFINLTGIADYMCAKNVLLAHAKVYHLYDQHYRKIQNGTIGISISCTWYEPASETEDDLQAAVDARRFDWGQYANPIFSIQGDFPTEMKVKIAFKSGQQGYSRSRLPELSAEEVALIRGSADFFGINTYSSNLAYKDTSLGMYPVPSYLDDMGAVSMQDPSWPQAQTTWLRAVPWGFYKLLMEVKDLYGNPLVYITENGWSTAGGLLDDDRISYYKNYLSALLDAIDEGCNVRAYTAWSLIDNFEWTSGYTEKFGLYEVDFSSPNRTRTARKSALVYRQIARSRQLDLLYEPDEFIGEDDNNFENFV